MLDCRYLDGTCARLAEYVQMETDTHSRYQDINPACVAAKQSSEQAGVDIVAAADLTYDDFVRHYMATNTPVLITVAPLLSLP